MVIDKIKREARRVINTLGLDIVRYRGPFNGKRQVTFPDDWLADLHRQHINFKNKIQGIKRKTPLKAEDGFWFPYDVLSNLFEINCTLKGENRDLLRLIGDRPIADIGGADGELSFLLEANNIKDIHLIDCAAVSCNGQKGARVLKEKLNSNIQIHDIDLDSQFKLPVKKFGLVFFLGTLYHLKNPFYALEYLSRHTEYCIMCTQIARFLPGREFSIADKPVAYLLDKDELNNDPSNFWIFTEKSVSRLLERTGWEVLDSTTFSVNGESVPNESGKLDKIYCLLKSRHH